MVLDVILHGHNAKILCGNALEDVMFAGRVQCGGDEQPGPAGSASGPPQANYQEPGAQSGNTSQSCITPQTSGERPHPFQAPSHTG